MIPMGPGKLLQRERVDRKLALDEIADATKISTRFLKSIESENFEALPGVIFTRNFVRQYAVFLGMDPEPLLAMLPRFDLESAPMPQPPNRVRKSIWDPRRSSVMAGVMWTLLAGGAAVAAYLHFNRQTSSIASVKAAVAAAPPAVPHLAPAPVEESKVSLPPEASILPQLSVPASDAAPSRPVQVVVAARQQSWVQASADGKNVFSGMLKAGESRSIAADAQVKVRTGNAGGVAISLNGKPLDSLGPEGQVRSIILTAEGLQPASPEVAPAPQNPPSEPSPV